MLRSFCTKENARNFDGRLAENGVAGLCPSRNCSEHGVALHDEKKCGSIVLFGGTRSELPRACATNAAYLGAKTGLSVIARSVAREYGSIGIRCNVILPGFTGNAPQGFLSEPMQIAEKAVYVIEQRDVNGVFFNVDYGWM